jgi:hypothetical protein
MVCKVSIVIPASQHGGAILDLSAIPKVGDRIPLGDAIVEIMEVTELLPPRGDFHFVHATCRLIGEQPPSANAARPEPPGA